MNTNKSESTVCLIMNPPLGLLHDFRCHPAWRAYKGVPCHLLVTPGAATLHGGRNSKVCQQNLTGAINQNIPRL